MGGDPFPNKFIFLVPMILHMVNDTPEVRLILNKIKPHSESSESESDDTTTENVSESESSGSNVESTTPKKQIDYSSLERVLAKRRDTIFIENTSG
jgi:hypothetical protein